MRRIAFEEDANGNEIAVQAEDFDMESVYRNLDGEGADHEAEKRDAVRLALRAVLDIVLHRKAKTSSLVLSAGRNTLFLAYACGHHSMDRKKMGELLRLTGLKSASASRQLAAVRRRAGLL